MFLPQQQRSKDGKERGHWSLVETVRTPDGPRQRTIGYLGALTGSAEARWQNTIEVSLRRITKLKDDDDQEMLLNQLRLALPQAEGGTSGAHSDHAM